MKWFFENRRWNVAIRRVFLLFKSPSVRAWDAWSKRAEPSTCSKRVLHFKRHSRFRLSHMPHAPAIGRNDDRRLVLYFLTTFIHSSLSMSSFLAAHGEASAWPGICKVAEREPAMLTKWTLHQQRRGRFYQRHPNGRLSYSPTLVPPAGMTMGSSGCIFNNFLFPVPIPYLFPRHSLRPVWQAVRDKESAKSWNGNP